jgi:hypothetical protein
LGAAAPVVRAETHGIKLVMCFVNVTNKGGGFLHFVLIKEYVLHGRLLFKVILGAKNQG